MKITVGNKPFPPQQIGDREPLPLTTSTVTVPGFEATVTVDAARVTQGEDFERRVTFANRGSQRVAGMTGMLTGGVRADGDDHLAGDFAKTTFIHVTTTIDSYLSIMSDRFVVCFGA